MAPSDSKRASGTGGFGGFRSSTVILLFAAATGLGALGGALLPRAMGIEADPTVEASRVALGSFQRAQNALSDPSLRDSESHRAARTAMAEAAGALSELAAPRTRSLAEGGGLGMGLWMGLGALALGLFGSWLWLETRWARPMAEAERRAWLHVHGEPLTELDEELGSRDARSLARLLNALIEHGHARAQLALEQDRAAFRGIERALETLGGGDLSSSAPAITGNLEPIARAIEVARRELAERLREIHREATQLAEGSAGTAKAARRMATAFGEQREALARISEEAESSAKELKGAARRLEEGLEGLQEFSRELRRSAQQHRAELSVAARRLGELRAVLAELAAAEERLVQVEDCLGLLDEFRRRPAESEATAEGAKVLSTRAALALKRGREAVESLKQDLERVRRDASQVALTLAETSASAAPSGTELEPAVLAALQESGLQALRIEERLLDALRLLERGATELSAGTQSAAELAERAQGAGPRLARAIADLRLDGHLEAEVLAHLAQLEADLVVAEETGLSPMGQAALAEVLEAAQASRTRLSRLIAQTEATVDIVRGA